MTFVCVMNLNILFFIFWFVLKFSFGKEYSSDGVNCISCNEYQNFNDEFPLKSTVSCKTGDSCADDHLKLCQMKLKCYALNDCTQAGIFPDVIDDSKYYVCLNDASSGFLKYDFTCPEQNFFDKATLTCVARDVTLDITELPTSLSPSTDPNSSSSSTDTSSSSATDPSSLSPSTDPGSSSVSTDPNSSSTLTSSTSTSSTKLSTSTDPISSTTPSTSTTPSPTTGPFECMASGIFPKPDNCKMYYRCSTSLKVFFYICPGNSYFNENILKCSMIISPACQEQILKNSTSTLPPTTPALTTTQPITTTTPPPTTPVVTIIQPTTTTSAFTTVTTTTPSPTTTTFTSSTVTTITTQSPVATTTISFSSTPFSCPVTGIFADPLSCKTYYRCTLSGTIFQYICPGNTYFNELTNRCSLVVTPRCRSLIIQG